MRLTPSFAKRTSVEDSEEANRYCVVNQNLAKLDDGMNNRPTQFALGRHDQSAAARNGWMKRYHCGLVIAFEVQFEAPMPDNKPQGRREILVFFTSISWLQNGPAQRASLQRYRWPPT
jgi:hypothetical protein